MNQGKLGLGYRCATEDTPAMILANLIFGGTSNSKLFMNVREQPVPVLLRLQQLRPQQGHHDRLQRRGAEGL